VGAGDETELVLLQERLDDVAAERVRHTAVVLTPPTYVLHSDHHHHHHHHHHRHHWARSMEP